MSNTVNISVQPWLF